jgi:hypothetical protein
MKLRRLAYALAGSTLVALWLTMIFLPHLRQRTRLDVAIAQAEWQLGDFNRLVRELPAFMQMHRELTLRRQRLNSSLYAKQDILELFRQLGISASEHDLDLVEISPPVDELLKLNRIDVDSNEPQFLNITLGLRGTYTDFGRFVEDLEAAPYFRGVNSCYLRGDPTPKPAIDGAVSFQALIRATGESG